MSYVAILFKHKTSKSNFSHLSDIFTQKGLQTSTVLHYFCKKKGLCNMGVGSGGQGAVGPPEFSYMVQI